jgi:hypothetical protein
MTHIAAMANAPTTFRKRGFRASVARPLFILEAMTNALMPHLPKYLPFWVYNAIPQYKPLLWTVGLKRNHQLILGKS